MWLALDTLPLDHARILKDLGCTELFTGNWVLPAPISSWE
jgi:hypothetical protein